MLDVTVLFVDDLRTVLEVVKHGFKTDPFKKLFAHSAKEALEIIEKEKVDIIVTDIMMPDMSGLELLNIVKEIDPDIVRIVQSGLSDSCVIIDAINKGDIFKYINKPFQVNETTRSIIYEAINYRKILLNRKQEIINDINSRFENFYKFYGELASSDLKVTTGHSCFNDFNFGKEKINYTYPLPYIEVNEELMFIMTFESIYLILDAGELKLIDEMENIFNEMKVPYELVKNKLISKINYSRTTSLLLKTIVNSYKKISVIL